MSDDDTSGERHPLAPFVDLFVYAPLGAALALRERLPELIELGRVETENRLRVARMIGEFAFRYGQREMERWVGQTRTAPPAQAPAPTVDAPARPTIVPSPTALCADDLPVPAYDSLAASQVVARLPSLTIDELEAVREYESATRRRRTILNRIEQLAG